MRLRDGWLALAFLALTTAVGQAAGFVALDLNARVAAAETIVVGVVEEQRVEERAGEPWTLVTLRVERWFVAAGAAVASDDESERPERLQVAFWGGNLPDGRSLQVAGIPTFATGERVLWMLRAASAGLAAPTVGVTQGVWRDQPDGWRGDDGSLLSLDEEGRLVLEGVGVNDDILFEALESAIAEVVR